MCVTSFALIDSFLPLQSYGVYLDYLGLFNKVGLHALSLKTVLIMMI